MYFIALIIFLLGLSLGSFANSLIWRLANDLSFKGRSQCPKCHQKIRFFDNIPIFSFLILKGRCRNCKQKISWQYPLLELMMGIFFVLVFLNIFDFQILDLNLMWQVLKDGMIWALLRDLLAIFILLIIFVFDWRFYLIPVNLLIIFVPFFWLFNILLGITWWWPLLAAVIVVAFFLFQFLITKGKGLGEGDIWLGGTLAFLFPVYQQLIITILLAYFLGSIIGILFIVFKKKQWQSKMPLGVFLVIASIISLFFAEFIWQYYWGFFI
jgi:leader peptidase (prepilin peptidase) / N-methyltransferase